MGAPDGVEQLAIELGDCLRATTRNSLLFPMSGLLDSGHPQSGHPNSLETNSASPLVGTAVLEGAVLPLHQQIAVFGHRARQQGLAWIRIVPLFLLRGTHVAEDLPREVAIAQAECGPALRLELGPHVGSHPHMASLIGSRMEGIEASAWILLAHGSRYSGGNHSVEALAHQLSMHPAYWSQSPSLETNVRKLKQQGHTTIGIVPYFLFRGGTIQAIAQQVNQLQEEESELCLHLTQPLGEGAEFVSIVQDLCFQDSCSR